jgi:hypothetical protein
MLHSLFGSNRPMVLVFLLIPAIVLGVLAYLYGSPPVSELGGPVFDWLFDWLNPYWLKVLLGIIINLAAAILINSISNNHDYADKEQYFPALVYFITASLSLSWQVFNPVLAGNLFVLLALRRLLAMSREQNVIAMVFDAGVFLGIAVLFYPPILFVFPFLWMTHLQFKSFNLREWLVALSGVLLPALYALAAYWWFSYVLNISEFYSFHGLNTNEWFQHNDVLFYLLSASSLVIFILGAFRFIADMSASTVHRKNTKRAFIWLSLLLTGIYFYSSALEATQDGLLFILLIPFAIYGGVFFTESRQRKLNVLFFYLWLMLSIAYMIFSEIP